MELIKNIRIRNLITEIQNAGGKVYLAGGSVRDMMLERESKDLDFEVYGLDAEVLGKILHKNEKKGVVGKSFEVFKVYDRDEKREYDFSIPKKRIFTINEETGKEEIQFLDEPFLAEEEACKRRDLTINAMLYDLKNDIIVDYFGGLDDIKNKKIKMTVDNVFNEDPLRILRAVQFMARFEFEIEEETEKKCIELSGLLKNISKERIFYEIEKILLKAEKPSIAFRWMKRTGILKLLFPEIEELVNVKDGEKYHGEENVFEHSMMALDCVPIEKRSTSLMIAVLYHDIGKLYTKTEDEKNSQEIHFYGHEKKGFEAFAEYIVRLTDNREIKHEAGNLILYHTAPLNMSKGVNRKQIRRLASKVDIPKLMILHEADILGRLNKNREFGYIAKIAELYEEIKNEIKPLIKGRDLIELGFKTDEKMGIILKEIYEAQLDEKFLSKEEGIEYVIRTYNIGE